MNKQIKKIKIYRIYYNKYNKNKIKYSKYLIKDKYILQIQKFKRYQIKKNNSIYLEINKQNLQKNKDKIIWKNNYKKHYKNGKDKVLIVYYQLLIL